MSQAGDRFRHVSCSQLLLDQLRSWADRAHELGLGDQVQDSLRAMWRQMTVDPLGWGDPIYQLPEANLLVHRGRTAVWYVEYAVHLTKPVVFVRSFQLVPGHPLGSAPPEEGASG